MTVLLYTVIGFFSGSLMFSAWIAKLALRRDLGGVGDGNPGATNVFKAGGKAWGALALILDVCKGAIPVGLAAQVTGIEGWALLPIALAPVIGHAFSPWLNFNGGKAMAVTLGVWIGLTLWLLPLIGLVTLVIVFLTIDNSGWSAASVFLVCGIALALLGYSAPYLAALAINAAIVLYKYRADLTRRPRRRVRRGAASA